MATFTNFLAKQTPYLTPITKTTPINPLFSSIHLPIKSKSKQKLQNDFHKSETARRNFIAAAAAATGAVEKASKDARVQRVHNIQEFDDALRDAKNRLVVVEYATTDSDDSRKIYPFMVDLSRSCNDVNFLLVVGDESEETRKLIDREKIEQVVEINIKVLVG